MAQVKNQRHKIPKKKKNAPIDPCGNNRKRMYFKSGNATILFCRGLTKEGNNALENAIKTIMADLGTKLEGTFFQTPGK